MSYLQQPSVPVYTELPLLRSERAACRFHPQTPRASWSTPASPAEASACDRPSLNRRLRTARPATTTGYDSTHVVKATADSSYFNHTTVVAPSTPAAGTDLARRFQPRFLKKYVCAAKQHHRYSTTHSCSMHEPVGNSQAYSPAMSRDQPPS